MPLPSSSASRSLKHTRQITIEGYARDDGLWDIDARITDRKQRPLSLANGTVRPAGELLHDMHLRVTIDAQMNIVDVLAVTDAAPFMGTCETITPVYRQLIGLNLFNQFRQNVRDRTKGVAGCTHITELCSVLPTAALQSLAGEVKLEQKKPDDQADNGEQKPFALDKCHAMRTDGELARLYYPKWYRAPAKKAGEN